MSTGPGGMCNLGLELGLAFQESRLQCMASLFNVIGSLQQLGQAKAGSIGWAIIGVTVLKDAKQVVHIKKTRVW